MNILIPHSWLLEHLDTQATPKQIQKYLSLCGPSVETIKIKKGEPIYDIEITTNRVDSTSVKGIAREAATILPEFGISAKLITQNLPSVQPPKNQKLHHLKIINNPKLCHRLVGVILSNIKLKPSPEWMTTRLEQVGMRGLNNAIDITNFAMHEIGHPIHAFDYDRLPNKKIIVRQAKKGESFTTLDGKKYKTLGKEIVFDDGDGNIIDLPGIMGTQNTVVTKNTKNILLFVESSDARLIRHASMSHGIRTQAAQLNEKHVDPELALTVLKRATQLFQKLADARVSSEIIDIYPNKPILKTTIMTQNKLDTYLGVHIKPQRVIRILTNLGCKVTTNNKKNTQNSNLESQTYKITPPTFRSQDLQIPVDYIEEIARIYGYHNLPSKIMDTPIPTYKTNINHKAEHRIKQLLSGWGLQEVYTYSMVNPDLALQSGYPLKRHLKIKNPLSDDWVYLRRSLIPSHQEVISQNKNHQSISIFELANTYHPQKNKPPNHRPTLTVTTTKPYQVIKGYLEALFQKLYISNTDFSFQSIKSPNPYLPRHTAQILLKQKPLGTIGKLKTPKPSFALEISFDRLIAAGATHPDSIHISTTTPIIEDLTFTLPQKTHIGPIIDHIRSTDPLVDSVKLKTIYQQNYTFTIGYLDPQSQLSDRQITPLRKKIVVGISQKFKGKLVGNL